MMKWAYLIAAAPMILSGSVGNPAFAQEMTLSAPERGDPVVIYTHRFKPGDLEAGKAMVIEGFSAAMESHGEDRLTFFLVDEEASEVIAVSIFLDGADVEKWHGAMARQEVLKALEPMRRQPLILQDFTLEAVHLIDR